MVEGLDLRLLGSPDFRRDGAPLTGFNTSKVQALLCFLAVTAQPHRRPALAGLLWGEMPEANAQNNLRKALSNLRELVGPHLIITRQTVAFNLESPYSLDVETFQAYAGTLFETGPGSSEAMSRMEEGVRLYRGDFLDGFTVSQAPAFEEWVLARRARLRELALQALHTLTMHYTRLGEAGFPLAIGYVSRLLALEPWREEAHGQLMLLLALSGQRGAALAQYKTCRQVLETELGVEPGASTVRLYEQIRDDRVELIPRLPAFLVQDAPEEPAPVFVARQRELADLGAYLADARAGRGRIVFVTGGPGRGKTALLAEFARRALAADPELLVAGGRCNAFSGAGDPFLPFREILGMLTGDVESRWAAGAISRDHAWRLWGAVPLAVQTLLRSGPNVAGILVDGDTLLSRATAAAASPGASWLVQLQDRLKRRDHHGLRLEPDHLCAEVVNVLRSLSNAQPLLLYVDDLQWIDLSTIRLLRILSRRLTGSRILIICAYRPEEVTAGPDGEPHPLESALAEVKARFGHVWLDLAQVDSVEALAFVDAFLDTEHNRLGHTFRETLTQRTGGHPLFTIELLRSMQERGDLARDAAGCWAEAAELSWDKLPSRVEGVIEQRIGLLDSHLRDLLVAASVEGEAFTAQVLGKVQGLPERETLGYLSRELSRQHRLVRAVEEVQTGRGHLSRYRFTHVLFRDYLYARLSPGERRLLHHEVGAALEDLYGDQVTEVAAQLAVHFTGHPEKERRYARQAGEQAVARCATEEAIRHLSRALEMTPSTDPEALFATLLARERVYHWSGRREAQLADLQVLEAIAERLADRRKQAEVDVRRAGYYARTDDYDAAVRAAEAAIRLLQADQDASLLALAHRTLGEALGSDGKGAAARDHLEKGLALARQAGDGLLQARLLRKLSNNMAFSWGDYAQAANYLEEALPLFRKYGSRLDEARVLFNMGFVDAMGYQYQQALDHWTESVSIALATGAAAFECVMRGNLGGLLMKLGDFEAARQHVHRGALLSRQVDSIVGESLAKCILAMIDLGQGRHRQALLHASDALVVSRRGGLKRGEAMSMVVLGRAYEALGQLDSAVTAYEQSRSQWQQLLTNDWTPDAVAGLARVHHARAEIGQALNYVEEILANLEPASLGESDYPLEVYLTAYQILRAYGDPRATTVLAKAHRFLWSTADRIADPELRRCYLENVKAHRELVALAEANEATT